MLNDDLLKRICPASWVARSMGDYLMDCSRATMDMLGYAIQNAAFQDLDTLIDHYHDSLAILRGEIVDIACSFGKAKQRLWGSVRSNAEYAEKVLNVYASDSELQGILQTAINDWLSDQEYTFPINVNQCSDVISTNMDSSIMDEVIQSDEYGEAEFNFFESTDLHDDSPIWTDVGAISASDFFKYIVARTNFPTKVLSFAVTNFQNVVTSITFEGDEIIESIKESVASSAAWAAGFYASVKTTVADAISDYTAKVGMIVTDMTERFTATVSHVKGVLSSVVNSATSFFETAYEELGWKSIINDSFIKPNSTDVFSYTGASPLAAIAIKSILDVPSAAAKTAMAIQNGVVQALARVMVYAYVKIRPNIMALSDNPVDIVVADSSDDSYTIQNFKYNFNHTVRMEFAYDNNEYTQSRILALIRSLFGGIAKDWFSIETYFMESMFRINSYEFASTYDDVNVSYVRFDVNYDFVGRPKCLNSPVMENIHLASFQGGTWNFTGLSQSSYEATWDKFLKCSSLYCSTDADMAWEQFPYMGFAFANMFQATCVRDVAKSVAWDCMQSYRLWPSSWQNLDMVASGRSDLGPSSDTLSNTMTFAFATNPQGTGWPTNISNQDFISICSGYNPDVTSCFNTPTFSNASWRFGALCIASSDYDQNYHFITGDFLAMPLIQLLFMQRLDRSMDPTNYLYLPYCRSTYAFSEGRYYIRTDADNANIATLLADVIILAVIIVAAIVIAKSVKRAVRASRLAHYSSVVGSMDSKMWSGKTLSYSESLKYYRYTNKKDKLMSMTSGFCGAQSMVSYVSSKTTDLLSGLFRGDSNDAAKVQDDISSSSQLSSAINTQTQDIKEYIDDAEKGVNQHTTLLIVGE